MPITGSALSLNVADPIAAAEFVTTHLGFTEEMSADGFVSLAHAEAGFNLIFLRTGLPTFKPASHAAAAGPGLLIAFVVDDVDAEYERLRAAGADIVTPIETEPWGERYFQLLAPGGIVFQFVSWVS